MNKCVTCKFWQKPESPYDTGASLGLRLCKAVPMFWESTVWNEDGDARGFKTPPEVTAFVQDGSDYSADLYTKAEHGCTMHQSA